MGMGYRPSALIIATMDTEHYTFTACGATYISAKHYLLSTFNHHLRQCGMASDAAVDVEELESRYDIKTMRVFPGLGMRDGEPIWTKDQ